MVPSRALFDKVNSFLQALDESPMAPLRPGLTPAQLRQTVSDLQPELSRLVDSTIDPGVTTDGLCLSGLDRLLEGSRLSSVPTELRDNAFPLSYNDMGRTYWLVKRHIDDPWYIAWGEKEHELTPPHDDPKGPAVLFSEYLQWALDVEWPLSGPDLKFPHTTNAK